MSDLIDRKAILKKIDNIRHSVQMMDDTHRASIVMNGMHLCEEAVRNQPSAEPERKRGKWVGVKEYCDHLNEKAEREGNGHRFIPSGMNICVYCNQCWESNDRRTTYCPNCGADMRGEEDDNIVR